MGVGCAYLSLTPRNHFSSTNPNPNPTTKTTRHSAVDAYLASKAGKALRPSRKKGQGWRVMDAGCGTGLAGVLFRNLSGAFRIWGWGGWCGCGCVDLGAFRNLGYGLGGVGVLSSSFMIHTPQPP